MTNVPIIYHYSVCTTNLNDAPLIERSIVYTCRSPRAIQAQRRAIAQRADHAASAVTAPAESIITLTCDDEDPNVRYFAFYPVGRNHEYDRIKENRD